MNQKRKKIIEKGVGVTLPLILAMILWGLGHGLVAFTPPSVVLAQNSGTGVEIEAGTAKEGYPGAVVTYTHRITTAANVSGTFNIAALSSRSEFETQATPGSIELEEGASVGITVTVEIPIAASAGLTNVITVTVTHADDLTITATTVNTTTVAAVYGVDLTPATAAQSAAPGEVVSYDLTVTNSGNITDNIGFTASGNDWTVVSPSPVTLGMGESVDVAVTVEIPADAAAGAEDTATITAASTGDPDESASSVLTSAADTVYGVELAPDMAAQSGLPGEVVTYTLTVTNAGNATDSFGFDVADNNWVVGLPMTVTLDMGQSVDVTVTVEIPADAAAGAEDAATITAASTGDPDESASSVLTSAADTVYGVELAPDAAAQSGAPGEVVTYTLTVTNAGNATDSFSFDVDDNNWVVGLPMTVLLDMGESVDVEVTVEIPADAAAGDYDVATVTATSVNDPSATAAYDLTTLTTTADAVYGVALAPATAAQSGAPGEVVSYTLTVTNTGNITDVFSFAASSNDWTVVSPSPVTLGMDELADVAVTVEIPADAAGGATDTVTVTATSAGDPDQSASSVLTSAADTVYGVELVPDAAAQSGDPGRTVTYTHTLVNQANSADTFEITLSSSAGFTPTLVSAAPITLPAGGSAPLTVTVAIPAGAAAGLEDVTSVVAASQGDENVTATAFNTTTVNMVAGMALTPTMTVLHADPGETVLHHYTVTNTGNATDTFAIEAESSQAFPFTIEPPAINNLPVGGSAVFTVAVSAPYSTLSGTIDITSVTVASDNDATVTTTATARTQVNVAGGVAIAPDPDPERTVAPGQSVVYTHVITNTGNATDTLQLSFITDFVASLSWESVELSPGVTATLDVTVTVPRSVSAGVEAATVVTVTSTNVPTVTAAVTNTAIAGQHQIYLPAVLRDYWSPGWYETGIAGRIVYALAACDNGRLFAGTDDGVWVGQVGTNNWTQKLPGRLVRGVAAAPDCSAAFATTWGQYVHRTTDNGQSWQPYFQGESSTQYTYSLLYASGQLFIGTGFNGLFHVDAGGTIRQLAEIPTNVAVPGLSQNGETVLVATWGSGVYFSSLSDNAWHSLQPPELEVFIAVSSQNNDVITVGANNSLYQWRDNGWHEAAPPHNNRTPALLADGNEVYAGQVGNQGVLRMQVGENSWQAFNNRWMPPEQVRAFVLVEQDGRQWLYAGTSQGVWRYPLYR